MHAKYACTHQPDGPEKAARVRHLPCECCYAYDFEMGIRQNGPLGFGFSNNLKFTPQETRFRLRSRYALPEPMGAANLHGGMMNITPDGRLGLGFSNNLKFMPNGVQPTLPPRFVLPGPIGTSNFYDAVKMAFPRFSFASKLTIETQKLDYDLLYEHIIGHEGIIRHMYLDTHKPPLVTVGAGNMLPNEEAAIALPFVNTDTGKPATNEEIIVCYRKVAAMPGSKVAINGYYKQKPNLEINVDFFRELAINRLKKEFVPSLRRHFESFNRFPMPAQEAIIDIAYNGGVGSVLKQLPLRRAIENYDWETAARIVGTQVAGESEQRTKRKAWRSRLFKQAHHIDLRNSMRTYP